MMNTGDIGEVTVDGNDIAVVTQFVFLAALITKEGRRISMGKAAMGELTSIWKDRGDDGEGEMWCWRRVLRVSWMERKTNIIMDHREHNTGMDTGGNGDKSESESEICIRSYSRTRRPLLRL